MLVVTIGLYLYRINAKELKRSVNIRDIMIQAARSTPLYVPIAMVVFSKLISQSLQIEQPERSVFVSAFLIGVPLGIASKSIYDYKASARRLLKLCLFLAFQAVIFIAAPFVLDFLGGLKWMVVDWSVIGFMVLYVLFIGIFLGANIYGIMKSLYCLGSDWLLLKRLGIPIGDNDRENSVPWKLVYDNAKRFRTPTVRVVYLRRIRDSGVRISGYLDPAYHNSFETMEIREEWARLEELWLDDEYNREQDHDDEHVPIVHIKSSNAMEAEDAP